MNPIDTYRPCGRLAAATRREEPPSPPVAPVRPNPRMRIDPALVIVVTEFLDATGKVRQSAPTEAALEAYRRVQRIGAPQIEKPPGGKP